MVDESAQPSAGHQPPQNSEHSDLLAGRYRLGKILGQGGMGKVYRAEHVLMHKDVAIKVLRPELSANEEIVARFHREARAAAALDHPNVCQATDFGRNDEGAFFLVMEYLDGQTLEQLLQKRGALPVDRALHIARQIAAALAIAHAGGIIHRDLKPENIMLVDRHGDADTVKIMDFGIARMVATADDDGDDDGANRLTRQGMVYGTPHYMSPEQVAGENVDHRTDLYALGVVLFEMLAGEPPYDGDNIARVMGQHITAPIPPVEKRRGDNQIPSWLVDLVGQCLAKDRDERPASAIDLQDQLTPTPDAPPSSTTAPSTRAMTAITTATASIREATHEGLGRFQRFWERLGQTERWLVGTGAVLATLLVFAMVVTLAVLLFDSNSRQIKALEDIHQETLADEAVALAMAKARDGDRAPLDALLLANPDNPHLRALALEADLEAGHSVDVVDESEAILAIDDRYAHRPEFMTRLVDRVDDSEAAKTLLAQHMTKTVRSELARLARLGSRRRERDAAYELLEAQNQLASLPRWARVAADLRQASSCADRRELVRELAALGEPKAVAVLEVYDNSSRRGCGTLRLNDCHACMRDDLAQALEMLDAS